MFKILIIGEFDEELNTMNELLSRGFETQMCYPVGGVISGMLNMYNPDYILIKLRGLSSSQFSIFEEIISFSDFVPVVGYGTESEKQLFGEYFNMEQFEYIEMPCELEEVAGRLCKLLGVSPKTILRPDAANKGLPSILVVDDNAALLRNIKNMLQDHYKISLATSAAQCMKMLGQNKFDLIILDYEMPVVDGRQTLAMIRSEEDYKDMPVVFLTGNADMEHVKSVLDLNPAGYFIKPPNQDQLISDLDTILRKGSL